MTAPLACTRCGAAYEPVGANHTHAGLCPQCQPRALTDAELAALSALMAHDAAFVANDTAFRTSAGQAPAYSYPTPEAAVYADKISAELRRRGVLP